ncbi:MAG: FIMAH domain-containing protein, partial [Candidatus Thorarchaeota archaeon]
VKAQADDITITDLEPLIDSIIGVDTFYNLEDINDLGQLVGYYNYVPEDPKPAKSERRAFLWDIEDGLVELGTLGGRNSRANAINNLGSVVGFSHTGTNGGNHAYLWTAEDGMTDLGTLGGTTSIGFGINYHNHVVGRSGTSTGAFSSFLWTPEMGMEDLGTLGGDGSSALDINDDGYVVGTSETQVLNQYRAFLWTSAGGMIDLGTLGGPSSGAYAVNNLDQVVGFANHEGFERRPCLWEIVDGEVTITDLGSFGGSYGLARDINDLGYVVGYSRIDPNTYTDRAFLWTPENGMIDLGTLGGEGSWAYSINDFGQIMGFAETESGEIHSVMWQIHLDQPEEAVDPIIDEVETLIESEVLNNGEGNALTQMLDNAIGMIEDGQTRAAYNQLRSFIHLVAGLLAKGELSEAEGQSLISQAENLMNQLDI